MCDKLFSDADAKTEITAEELVIDKLVEENDKTDNKTEDNKSDDNAAENDTTADKDTTTNISDIVIDDGEQSPITGDSTILAVIFTVFAGILSVFIKKMCKAK